MVVGPAEEISRCLRALTEGPTLEISTALSALRILNGFALKDEYRRAIVSQSGVPVLSALLQSSKIDITVLAANALMNLAVNPSCRLLMGQDPRCIPNLVAVMEVNELSVREVSPDCLSLIHAVTGAIQNLAAFEPSLAQEKKAALRANERRLAICNSGALPKLVAIVESPKTRAAVKLSAMWAICNVAASDPIGKVIEEKLMPFILNILVGQFPRDPKQPKESAEVQLVALFTLHGAVRVGQKSYSKVLTSQPTINALRAFANDPNGSKAVQEICEKIGLRL